jgi:outer membrane protein insertion porin family
VFDYIQSTDRMIRGFEYGGIGPVASGGSGDHLGGATYFNASAEAQFPVPVIPESFGLRGAVFADAASLYGNKLEGVESSTTGMKLRASVGVGLMWASPFGPIRIDYAIPVKKQPTDNVQKFNFGIATRF